jgi:hypothetical protein
MTERLYLTYKDNAKPALSWGGYHITIVGSGNKTSFDKLRNTSFFDKAKNNFIEWRFSDKPVAQLEIWNGVWTIVFKSKTIDDLADDLIRLRFTSVKGPRSGTSWHISLNGADEESAKLLYIRFVEDGTRPLWHLTRCIENPRRVFTWNRVK